jgi:SsrA-binding protein
MYLISGNSRTTRKGLTLVPLRLYITGRGRAKVELGLARGKQHHDRRREIAARDAKRDLERELSEAMRR